MSKQITVLFRVEADAVTGTGHLMRCCALAVALDRLAPVACRFEPAVFELARAILATSGVRAEAATDDRCDIVVADMGPLTAEAVLSLRAHGHMLVSIDDRPGPVTGADVAVRPNTLPALPPKGARAVCAGREFILLQPAYADRNPPLIGETVRQVLVCFGGSDPADLSRRFVGLLGTLDRRAAFTLAIGPYYRWTAQLTKMGGLGPGSTVLQGATLLAHEMASCDLVLISGGTLAYEACALGRPAIVISQNAEQETEAKVLAKAGAILDAGRHDLVSDNDIVSVLRRLWDDYDARLRQSAKAAAFVPRDGARRVAAVILDQL